LHHFYNISQTEQLDGIDFDHEGLKSQEDWNAYQQFIVFAAMQMKRNNLLLSVAVHPGQYLQPHICQMVDRVHVMAYDMISSRKKLGHHADLSSVKNTIQAFMDKGCPSNKLVLGIPCYGRHGENPGLVKTYSEIMDDYFADQQTNTVNNFQSMNSVKGYYFDSPNDVRSSKVKYAKEVGLGGVFYWEVGQDKHHPEYEGGILLQAAATFSIDSVKEEL